MLLLEKHGQTAHLALGLDELLLLDAALNEVAHGVDAFEFEARIGVGRARILELLQEIGGVLDGMGGEG